MKQEDWNPNAQPIEEYADVGPINLQVVKLLTCVLCGAVVTRNSWLLHNRWHEDNKRPIKRIRSNQQKGE